ncbi:hypothetical protein CSC18_1601 [Klebsiella aerogenes]|nr:hypothetical protein CSC18_1601 [Klebsiella aerogenes]
MLKTNIRVKLLSHLSFFVRFTQAEGLIVIFSLMKSLSV